MTASEWAAQHMAAGGSGMGWKMERTLICDLAAAEERAEKVEAKENDLQKESTKAVNVVADLIAERNKQTQRAHFAEGERDNANLEVFRLCHVQQELMNDRDLLNEELKDYRAWYELRSVGRERTDEMTAIRRRIEARKVAKE